MNLPARRSMIVEACFDENADGALTMAKWLSPALGEPLLLPDNLAVGRLRPFSPAQRKRELLAYDGRVPEDMEKRYAAFGARISKADTVRIWMSNSPHEAVGAAYVCSCVTCGATAPRITMVNMSKQGNVSSVGASDPQDIAAHALSAEPCDVASGAVLWNRLCEENSPYRIVTNGRIVSVGENHFDELLRNCDEPGADPMAAAVRAVATYYAEEHALFSVYALARRAEALRQASIHPVSSAPGHDNS